MDWNDVVDLVRDAQEFYRQRLGHTVEIAIYVENQTWRECMRNMHGIEYSELSSVVQFGKGCTVLGWPVYRVHAPLTMRGHPPIRILPVSLFAPEDKPKRWLGGPEPVTNPEGRTK